MSECFSRIVDAYEAAIGGRDPAAVRITELLPAIFEAVPDAELEEVAAALEWNAQRHTQEADELRRYRKAKFGNVS